MRIVVFVNLLLLILFDCKTNAQWIKSTVFESPVTSLYVKEEKLFAGTYYGGIYFSSDNGLHWNSCRPYQYDGGIYAFTATDSFMFAGSGGNGIFRSDPQDSNWQAVNNGLTNLTVYALICIDNTLIAGTADSGVFISTNCGLEWTASNAGLTETGIHALAVQGTNIFAGLAGKAGVFLSKNNGLSWSSSTIGLYDTVVNSLKEMNGYLFAGTWKSGVYQSIDSGLNWQACNTDLPMRDITTFSVYNDNIITGGAGGVYLSTNQGGSWVEMNQGLPGFYVSASTVNTSFVFVSNWYNGVYRRAISDMIVEVRESDKNIIQQASLLQNFPNPFNSITNFRFQITQSGFVTLKIYNILGREVSTIVAKEMIAGNYTQRWESKDLPSGIYFYRLQTGTISDTKKLVLLK
jgi:hypothetical protein